MNAKDTMNLFIALQDAMPPNTRKMVYVPLTNVCLACPDKVWGPFEYHDHWQTLFSPALATCGLSVESVAKRFRENANKMYEENSRDSCIGNSGKDLLRAIAELLDEQGPRQT